MARPPAPIPGDPIDWDKVVGSKSTTSTIPPAGRGLGTVPNLPMASGARPSPSPSSGDPINWDAVTSGNAAGQQKPAKGHGAPSLLAQVGSVVKAVPSGLLGFGKEAAKTVEHVGLGPIAAAKFVYDNRDRLMGLHNADNPAEALAQVDPLTGHTVESMGRTVGDVVHPSRFARASEQGTLVSKILEDAANASIVLGPLARGAGAVADRTAAAAAAEGATEQAAGRAAAAQAAAKVLHGAARATEAVAAAPIKPFEFATLGTEAGPLLARIPGVEEGQRVGVGPLLKAGFDKAATSDGVLGQVARTAKIDPASRLLRKEALTPAMEDQSAAIGRQVKLAQQVEKVLPDPVEQQAMFAVGEGQGHALATMLLQAPDRFDEFVKSTFGDTLSPEAARLAAQVASGVAPADVAARISQALEVGAGGPGGRLERSASYLDANPGRGWQFGFSPNPEAIDQAVEQASRHLPRAQDLAKTLRERAQTAQARLEGASGDLSAQLDERAQQAGERQLGQQRATLEQAVSRQEQRAVDAADRLTSAQDLAEAAKVAPPAAELSAQAQQQAGRLVAANDRAAIGLDRGLPSTVDRRAAAEAAAERLDAVLGKAERAGTRQGTAVGRAQEKAAQADRLQRLESRNLGSLTAKLEKLPEEAAPAHVQPTYGMGKRLGSLDAQARAAQRAAERADAVVGRIRERVGKTAAEVANSVEAAPARLRPALEVGRRAQAELAQHAQALREQGLGDAAAKVEQAAGEIPATLKALRDAGVDPDHFIHVQPGDKPTRAGVPAGPSLPQVKKMREEKFRGENSRFERTQRAQTQGEVDRAKQVIARQTAEKVATMPFAAKIGEGPLEAITLDKGSQAAKEAAAKAGYVPWDPRSPFETPAVVTKDTVFLPEHIKTGFRSYFGSNAVDRILRKTYDPAIQGIKVGQLALSPSWQVNNVLGNIAMATFGAGVDPITLASKIREAISLYRKSGAPGERTFEDAVAPRRLLTAGPTHSEFSYLRPPDEEMLGRFPKLQKAARTVGAPVRKLANLSYAGNEMIDNIGRSAVYLAKKSKGLDDEAAIRESLKAMGDFSRMTPGERMVVKRIIPYYAWMRHITQLAFRLPIEHPLRVAWTLHLADAYADPTTRDLVGSNQGGIRVGKDALLQPGRLWPFGDAGRVLEPSGIESSLSPILRIPIEARTGVNLSSGRPFTRPPGTGRHDEFGRDLPTAPSLLHQIGGLFPQKRLVDAATGRDQIVRYDTGDPVVTAKGPIPTDKTKSGGLLRFLGVPLGSLKAAQQQQASADKKTAAQEKTRAGYEKRRAKATKRK